MPLRNFLRPRRWLKSADIEPRVLQAFESASFQDAPRIDRRFNWVVLLAAAYCLTAFTPGWETSNIVTMVVMFACFQAMRLVLYRCFADSVAAYPRMTMGALANALPLGLFAIGAAGLEKSEHIELSLLLVAVQIGSMTAYPRFIGIQRTYNLLVIGGDTLGWWLSAHPDRFGVVGVLLCLMLVLEGASRRYYRFAIRTARLKVANRALTHNLQEKIAELENLNRSKTSLLAAACHDLRQPAHAMGILLEVAMAGNLDEETRYKLQELQRSNMASNHLLTALMDLARLDSGALQCNKVSMKLEDVLQEAKTQFFLPALQKGLTLEIPETRLHVKSDPYLLRRAVFNLLSNAIKYTRTGGVKITLRQVGNTVNLAIVDTGVGVAASRQKHIFEEYARLEEGGDGFGIGLSTVKRACQLMEHPLGLESTLGQGTTFTIQLEIDDRPTDHLCETEHYPSINGPREFEQAKLIAVIEDDPAIRQASVELLHLWNFDVVEAEGATAMIEMIRCNGLRPALLLSDLHLRGESGFAAIRAIRALPALQDMPAVLVTGDLDPHCQQMANNTSVELLHKPVSPRQLHDIIAKLVS